MDPAILKIVLMLQHSLLFCPGGWWVTATDDGASWRPPAELAHRSLKDSYDRGDQVHHNYSRDPLGDPCGIIVDLVYCYGHHVPVVNEMWFGLCVSSALLLPMIQVFW